MSARIIVLAEERAKRRDRANPFAPWFDLWALSVIWFFGV